MENSAVKEVSKLNKGIFGVEVTTNTEPSMRKTNNPYLGRVRKVSVYRNAILGVDYENAVNGRLERKGEVADYKADAPKGKKHYNAFFYVSDKDENVFYLKIGMRKNTNIESEYMVDGRIATAAERAEIETFLTSHSSSVKKQAEAGLDESEQYRIVAPKLENVVSIRLGGRTII
jgi:hypothetical protein